MISINTCSFSVKGKFIELQATTSNINITGLALYNSYSLGLEHKKIDLSHLLEKTSNTEILMIDLNNLGLNGLDVYFLEVTDNSLEKATGVAGNMTDIILQNIDDLVNIAEDNSCNSNGCENSKIDTVLYDRELIETIPLVLSIKDFKSFKSLYTYLKNKTLETFKCTNSIDNFDIITDSNKILCKYV